MSNGKAGTHRLAVDEVPPLCGWMQNNKKCLMLGFRWTLGPSPAGSGRQIPLIAWARPPRHLPPSPIACALLFRGPLNGVIAVADVGHLS